MKEIVIIFGTTGGNTHIICKAIANEFNKNKWNN